jgi:exosortase
LLGAALAWLYAPVAWGLAAQWLTNPDASYGAILAGVSIVLAWRRRAFLIQPTTPAQPESTFESACGILLLLGGLALYLGGLFVADLYTTRASFVVVAGGLAWFVSGRRAARVLAAPLMFLLLSIPLPELVVNAITLPLQLAASAIAESLLIAAGVPVFREGNVLEVPSITLQVAEACSGLRSAVSLAGVAALLAWSGGESILRGAAFVLSAVPIAVVTNGLRVAATGAACEFWSREAARGGWHTMTGWVTFTVSLLLLAAVWRVTHRECPPPLAAEAAGA